MFRPGALVVVDCVTVVEIVGVVDWDGVTGGSTVIFGDGAGACVVTTGATVIFAEVSVNVVGGSLCDVVTLSAPLDSVAKQKKQIEIRIKFMIILNNQAINSINF